MEVTPVGVKEPAGGSDPSRGGYVLHSSNHCADLRRDSAPEGGCHLTVSYLG